MTVGKSRHFYAESEHPLVQAGYNEWFSPAFDSYCAEIVGLWEQYRSLKRIAEGLGAQILNATAGGTLDVFPRVELPEALVRAQELSSRR